MTIISEIDGMIWITNDERFSTEEGDLTVALSFDINDYKVTINSQEVKLLRKEFLLLQYLYEHANRALSRQQLLDAVWPLQVPSDRTVDDHIYRLRKKLKAWSDIVNIETVKGFGYKLVFSKGEGALVFRMEQDEEFQELTQNLINKYHLYGHGEAMHQLIEKNTFGVFLEEDRQRVIQFLRGDFRTLIHTTNIPFEKRAFPLLALYFLLENDLRKMDRMFHKYEQAHEIGESWNNEDYGLFRILLDLYANRYTAAREKLVKADESISDEVPGSYGFYQLWWLMYALCVNDFPLADEKIDVLEQFFEKHFFQREYGLFLILQGFYYLHQRKRTRGTDLLSQSFTVIDKTQFVIHTLVALFVAEKLLTVFPFEEAAELIVQKKEEVYEQYELRSLKEIIKNELDQYL
ncbi:winged helix-turn-helix domain-containing protein [Evansella halocellulosilytica]|uniref:winged helix-turn-helix domain-containing protein n=1 Tax=Evansella halocellulosilytica TaxID=2011013 RepID=UPI000BB70D7D|nr:winged helix-turn-helix domain-containing protein [Evansella halocellulosilytica]